MIAQCLLLLSFENVGAAAAVTVEIGTAAFILVI